MDYGLLLLLHIKNSEMGSACSTMEDGRGADRVLVGKSEGKRPLGRPGRRLDHNIEIDLQAVGWGMDWNDLGQNRNRWQALVNTVMNLPFLKMRGIS